MKPSEWLILQKKVRFGDCDSAGVIHFHNLLKWSHEAWEESIEIYGIPYKDIFPDFSIRKSQIIFPIINFPMALKFQIILQIYKQLMEN